MSTWHGLVALGALGAVIRWYTWWQMSYWRSQEFREIQEREAARNREGNDHA